MGGLHYIFIGNVVVYMRLSLLPRDRSLNGWPRVGGAVWGDSGALRIHHFPRSHSVLLLVIKDVIL